MILYASTPGLGAGGPATSSWAESGAEEDYSDGNLQRFFIDLGINAVDVLILAPVHDAADAYSAAQRGDYAMAVLYTGFTICDVAKPCQSLLAPTKALRRAARTMPPITTPYGPAHQMFTRTALEARNSVENGATLWRMGSMGKSTGPESQFWALEMPQSAGFARRMGIPAKNVVHADFHESAVLRPGSPFITREAPGVGRNTGGGIEVVVPEGGVEMRYFGTIRSTKP
jgi:hypothetical protein